MLDPRELNYPVPVKEPRTECRWYQRHAWGKWEVFYREENSHYKSRYNLKRTCQHCGLIQLKVVDMKS